MSRGRLFCCSILDSDPSVRQRWLLARSACINRFGRDVVNWQAGQRPIAETFTCCAAPASCGQVEFPAGLPDCTDTSRSHRAHQQRCDLVAAGTVSRAPGHGLRSNSLHGVSEAVRLLEAIRLRTPRARIAR